jgi:hypothetical protein
LDFPSRFLSDEESLPGGLDKMKKNASTDLFLLTGGDNLPSVFFFFAEFHEII